MKTNLILNKSNLSSKNLHPVPHLPLIPIIAIFGFLFILDIKVILFNNSSIDENGLIFDISDNPNIL